MVLKTSFPAVFLCSFLSLANFVYGDWVKQDIGTSSTGAFAVCVGIGRSDGIARVYAPGPNNNVYETNYSSGWSQTDMNGMGHGIGGLCTGIGKNDGVPRVYIGTGTGYIFEFTYSSPTWTYVNVSQVVQGALSLYVGPGRNDGANRVYGACTNIGLVECSYSGVWSGVEIGGGSNCVTIGVGRNDGVTRVYSGDYTTIYESTYSSGWSQSPVGTPGSTVNGIVVGKGRNDGMNRIYAACGNGHIYEYSRVGSNWNSFDVGSAAGFCNLSLGAGRNDGINRIYGACSDGHIYEFNYTGSVWTKTDVGSSPQAMGAVSVGIGRNDNVVRVYCADYTGNLHEFTYVCTPFISAMVPHNGLTSSQITVSIQGKDLLGTSAIKLRNSKTNQNISGASPDVSSNSLTAQFSLPSTGGLFDLVLTNNGNDYVFKTCFTVLTPQAGPVRWQKTDLGKVGNPCTAGSIVIGDANRDNEAEVFVASSGQTISMLKESNSSWSVSNFLNAPGDNFQQLLILDGNRDGQLELYAGSARPQLYQYQWGIPSPSTPMGTNGSLMAAGDGNIDGVQELYSTSGNTTTGQGLDQWSYGGSTWNNNPVMTVTAGNIFTALLAGDGDNNATQAASLYAAYQDTSNNTNFYQFKYTGGIWNGTSITNPGSGAIKSLVLGDLDRNGQNNIYAANQDGKIYQLVYNNPGWSSTTINDINVVCNQIVVSDGNNDGQDEIYGAGQDGHAWQFRLNGNAWQTTDLGNAGTTLNAIAVGDGDNKFQFEVYALGSDGHVYQFAASMLPTATPTPVTPAAAIPQNYFKVFHGQINPNHNEQAKIKWVQPQTGAVSIIIYNLLGDKIKSVVEHQEYSAGEYHQVIWDGKNQDNVAVASGIYIVLLKGPGYQEVGKAAVIK